MDDLKNLVCSICGEDTGIDEENCAVNNDGEPICVECSYFFEKEHLTSSTTVL